MSLPPGERNRRARWEGASEGNCANAGLLSVLDVPLAAAIFLDRAAWMIALRMPLGLLQLSQLVVPSLPMLRIARLSQRERTMPLDFTLLSPVGRDGPAFAQLRLGERKAPVRANPIGPLF
jgi:hypothetical protein